MKPFLTTLHDPRVNIAYFLDHSDPVPRPETRSMLVPISISPGVYHGKDPDYRDPAAMINERRSCPPARPVGGKETNLERCL